MKHLRLLNCLLFCLSWSVTMTARTISSDSLKLHVTRPPVTLTTPDEQAIWTAQHYWDSLDFQVDTVRSLSRPFLEANFVTWSELFDHIDNREDQQKAVESLIYKAALNSRSMTILTDIAETILYDPQSPCADEGKYRLWVEVLLGSGQLDELETIRPKMQLEEMAVNPVGGKATDITVTLPDNSRQSLYNLLAKDGDTLLFFYDPDCHDCTEAVSWLTEIEGQPESPTIVAICVEGDREAWKEKMSMMPRGWTHVYAADILSQSLEEQGPYILPVMPTFYLLSSDGTVKTKNWKIK